MGKIHAKRLRKLADHLERNRKLEKFDFSTLLSANTFDTEEQIVQNLNTSPTPVCGTVGCAMGELPACFPKDWKYRVAHDLMVVQHKDQKDTSNLLISTSYLRKFFGIAPMECTVMFYPASIYRLELKLATAKRLGIRLLPDIASAEEVAANLRIVADYIENRKTKDIPNE